MKPVEDGVGKKTSISSLTDRVRSLATVRATSSGSDGYSSPRDGGTDNLAVTLEEDHRSHEDPELLFRDKAIRDLDPARSTIDRLATIEAISTELEFYCVDTLIAILAAAIDLTEIGASLESRKAGFTLLRCIVAHTGFSLEERRNLFEIVTRPVSAEGLTYQLDALQALTQHGKELEGFADALATYLPDWIASQYSASNNARRRVQLLDRGSKDSLPEERGFCMLLDFLSEAATASPDAFQVHDVESICKCLLGIAESATSTDTVSGVIKVIKVLIVGPHIPVTCLQRCIEDLCAICNVIPRLKDLTWECLQLLLRTETRQTVLDILLQTLALSQGDRQPRTVCGALQMVRYLFSNTLVEDLPSISFDRLIESMQAVYFTSMRVRAECLRTISKLLNDRSASERILQVAGWGKMVSVILMAAGQEIDQTLPKASEASSGEPSTGDSEMAERIARHLLSLAEGFNHLWTSMSHEQRSLVSALYYKLQCKLPRDFVRAFVEQLYTQGFYSKGTDQWIRNQREMLELFVLGKQVDRGLRCAAIQILQNESSSMNYEETTEVLNDSVIAMLNDFPRQKDLHVANALAQLVITFIQEPCTDPERVKFCLTGMWPLLRLADITVGHSAERRASGETGPLLNTVSTSLVELFLLQIDTAAESAILTFNTLTDVVADEHLPPSVRLPAMKLLTRVRCDLECRILVIESPDTLGLEAALGRTEAAPEAREEIARPSLQEDRPLTRSARSSGMTHSVSGTNSRSSIRQERQSKPSPPLWAYPGEPALPIKPPSAPSELVRLNVSSYDDGATLRISSWMYGVLGVLQNRSTDWEVYSYILVHLPSQLSNRALFRNAIPYIKKLRAVIYGQLMNDKVYEPPASTGVKTGDVALCLYQSLAILLGYCEHFEPNSQEQLVQAFHHGIVTWDRVAQPCIQALAICCHEIPSRVVKSLSSVLQKFAQIITQSRLAIDILEFLAGLGRLRHLYANFIEEEYRTVFAICVRYLEHSREQRLKLRGGASDERRSSNLSGRLSSRSDNTIDADLQKDLPQYVFALAYHVMTIWFLSLKLTARSSYVGFITRSLAWQDSQGIERMEEQSQVTLDMMLRTAYLDLGETEPLTPFGENDGPVVKKTWLIGLSIVTIETATTTGLSLLTKRQASGTTYARYMPNTVTLPAHHEPLPEDGSSSIGGFSSRINVFPNHVLLQLTSSIAPTPAPMEPISLPDDETSRRAISAFDRNDTVDGYKVGVIYLRHNQTQESDILANTRGSPAFEKFLDGLGTKVELKGATFNTQGLDRVSDADGTHTYAWRDRVTEIVYHIPTMMPSDLENDPSCINKKRHIGNDFVNIIWNESGLPFDFDTFPSQFNCVNIVIVPDGILQPHPKGPLAPSGMSERGGDEDVEASEHQRYYRIQTISNVSFPQISPTASYKLLPFKTLAPLARQLALHSAIFSNVWTNRDTEEHASSWRNRLREIKRLRERYCNTGTSTSAKFPGVKGAATYKAGDEFHGRVLMGGLAENEGLIAGLDFSRWAGPNPLQDS